MIPIQYRNDVLARTVAEVDPQPSSLDEIVVLLEVLGIAKSRNFDVFRSSGASEEVMQLVPFYSRSNESNRGEENRRSRVRQKLRPFVSGMIFNAVWSMMLAALFLGGISLWAAISPQSAGLISAPVAAAITIGVVVSFIATGGIEQVFSLRISYYRLQENSPLANKEAIRGYMLGFPSLIVAAALLYLAIVGWHLLPSDLGTYTLMFLVLLGTYRILAIPLYAYKKFGLITVGLCVALLSLYFAFSFLHTRIASVNIGILTAQVVGLAILDVITAAECVFGVLRGKLNVGREERNLPFYTAPSNLKNVKPPRLSVVFLEVFPLFVFGKMFYVFLFLDRLTSWIPAGGSSVLVSGFRYQYGADVALLILIPMSGVIYYFTHSLNRLLKERSQETRLVDQKLVRGPVSRYVVKMLAGIGSAALLSTLVLWQFAPEIVRMIRGGPETLLALRISLVAYSIFGVFMATNFISFSFRRYTVPTLLLFVGALTELALNTMSTHLTSSWNPVYGLLCAVVVVTLIGTAYTAGIVRRIQYFHYSSF